MLTSLTNEAQTKCGYVFHSVMCLNFVGLMFVLFILI